MGTDMVDWDSAESNQLRGHDSTQSSMMEEVVIQVDELDNRVGGQTKLTAHYGSGFLHRAFSVLVFDSDDRILLQKRSSDKITFPGVWANSCCSHPLDVESERNGFQGTIVAAIRKMEQELGVDPSTLKAEDFIPASRMLYWSRSDDEWLEKELDHLLILRKDIVCNPNPNEIEELRWFNREEFSEFMDSFTTPNSDSTTTEKNVIAPWFKLIVDNLLEDWWSDLDSVSDDGKIHRFGRLDLGDFEKRQAENLDAAISRCRPKVEEIIMDALSKSGVERLRRAMTHLLEGGGKRVRATLPRLVGEALEPGRNEYSDHELAGAALEIIHNFTLVHDDIMDDDDVRRGRPSVHIEYDIPTAINAGDAMLAIGFEILVGEPGELDGIRMEYLEQVVRAISGMVRGVSEGQQLDIAFEKEENVGAEEYLRMIEGKTAIMFKTAAELGALLTGSNQEIVDICSRWGREMGMCFQLMDDLIDVLSDGETLGKPRGSDIAQGKRTLMVLHALEQGGDDAESLESILGSGDSATQTDIDTAIAILQRSGSIDHAREMAASHHKAAHDALDELPFWVELTALRELTDWQVKRIS